MIDDSLWKICKICNEEIKGGDGIYKSESFCNHLNKHNITIQNYFIQICGLEKKICSCGFCNKELLIIRKSSKFDYRKYACGRNPGILKWSKEAIKSRLGSNNPMFGKSAWNTGLTKETSDKLKLISDKRTGQKTSKETKIKQSISAKKRLIHGHTGCKHSVQTKEKFRQNTLLRIKNGDFKHNDTKPVRIFKQILDNFKIQYESEKIVGYWSFDLYLPKYNTYIEIDGDYFHSNPKIYPNGPKTKTQKINWYRDIKKNKYCIENNLVLLRFWECDILNNQELIINAIRTNNWN